MNINHMELFHLVCRIEPDLTPDKLILEIPVDARTGPFEGIRHLWRHEFDKNTKAVSLIDLSKIVTCAECSLEENLPELINQLQDDKLRQSCNELYWVSQIKPLASHNTEEILSGITTFDALVELGYEYERYKEDVFDDLSSVFGSPNKSEKHQPVINSEVDRMIRDLTNLRLSTLGSDLSRSMLSARAEKQYCISIDESEVFAVIDRLTALDFDPRVPWGEEIQSNSEFAHTLILAFIIDDSYEKRNLQSLPLWVYDAIKAACPGMILSQAYPINSIPNSILETAKGLWEQYGCDPLSSFETALNAAKHIMK